MQETNASRLGQILSASEVFMLWKACGLPLPFRQVCCHIPQGGYSCLLKWDLMSLWAGMLGYGLLLVSLLCGNDLEPSFTIGPFIFSWVWSRLFYYWYCWCFYLSFSASEHLQIKSLLIDYSHFRLEDRWWWIELQIIAKSSNLQFKELWKHIAHWQWW